MLSSQGVKWWFGFSAWLNRFTWHSNIIALCCTALNDTTMSFQYIVLERQSLKFERNEVEQISNYPGSFGIMKLQDHWLDFAVRISTLKSLSMNKLAKLSATACHLWNREYQSVLCKSVLVLNQWWIQSTFHMGGCWGYLLRWQSLCDTRKWHV